MPQKSVGMRRIMQFFPSPLSAKSLQSCLTLWPYAHQAPLSMGFFKQEYWSGLPYLPPGNLSDPGIQHASLMSPVLAGSFFKNIHFLGLLHWQAGSLPVGPSEKPFPKSNWLLTQRSVPHRGSFWNTVSENTQIQVCHMSFHPKPSPWLLPQSRAGTDYFQFLPRLKCLVSIYVFINLGVTCLSFQTLWSCLVSCIWGNWIWKLNLQFVIENGMAFLVAQW